MSDTGIKSLGSFVWSIAELLRGDFKQSEYGKVILPFVVLRRLDCILEETKQEVLDRAESLPDEMDDEARDILLSSVVGGVFNSTTCPNSPSFRSRGKTQKISTRT